MAWSLHIRSGAQSNQKSFFGGKPRLPCGTEIPICRLCGARQTFYFQVAFPEGATWAGNTLGVFSCTRCAYENHLIPDMLACALRGADIPEGFLTDYQKNFAFVVFPTDQGSIVGDYEESILFSEIGMIEGDVLGSFGKLGERRNGSLGIKVRRPTRGALEWRSSFRWPTNFNSKQLPRHYPKSSQTSWETQLRHRWTIMSCLWAMPSTCLAPRPEIAWSTQYLSVISV